MNSRRCKAEHEILINYEDGNVGFSYYACEDYRVKTFGKSKKEIREEREKDNKKKSEGDVYI